MTTMRMRVSRIDTLTPAIRRLWLVCANGAPLPGFEAGAHIGLRIPIDGRSQRRAYSLVNATDHAEAYEIAVQLEPGGTGGSIWVHRLQVGDELDVTPPQNDFPLDDAARSCLLIAGGIGITPILSMARSLERAGRPYDLHYAAREPGAMAYADEVRALARATCWFDGGNPSNGMPLETTIGAPQKDRHLYVCGPAGFIHAVLEQARQNGWPNDHLHCELFSATPAAGADSGFEVELTASGVTLHVPETQSILDAMIGAGLDPVFDCRRGDCGVCVTRVLSGEADHRDICLSDEDRDRGDFCPCVSRAKSARLVLDL
ncbi:PDR/VanB family oxidoreductase [Paraburkholderia silviterrae]|uniref:Oxidoreductase n=1 Tax=Paraburkholderia silviterrae TaxID=2528715 RepID=A0A4R5LZD4_9BURK|nr:PDR/VanB family oxidoreductase [Paraburkholderia silviterrae]TDG17960.1 oxidoreductase [Paraburkholderia silviterrae]